MVYELVRSNMSLLACNFLLYHFFPSPAQLSGNEGEDMDYEQIEELLHSERTDLLTRAKKAIYRLVKRVGFFGILLCASVSCSTVDPRISELR